MSLPLQVAEWEDVKHFFPEEWTPEEINDIATQMDDDHPMDDFMEQADAHEEQWELHYPERELT